jgi:sporulation protein YlmC with PRC-barrel domain
MTPQDRIRLAADLRDLQIIDSEGACCGIVDDVELDGKAGGRLSIAALLVGPGAFRNRLPGSVLWLIHRIAGDRVVRVPWSEVKHITSVVTLARPAAKLGLSKGEDKAKRMLPRIGAVDEAV